MYAQSVIYDHCMKISNGIIITLTHKYSLPKSDYPFCKVGFEHIINISDAVHAYLC